MSKSQLRPEILAAIVGLLGIPLIAAYVCRTESVLGQAPSSGDPFDVLNYEPQHAVSSFPAIENPKAVAPEQVGQQIQPNDLVLGVEINGASRAYPINQLTGPSREILNDRLGGQAIAATW